MPFTIERNDLSHMDVDAVVVTANEGLQINGGVGLAVARVAGLEQLQAACDELQGCPTGQAVVTPGFALAAKYVIHVVGPVWQGGTQGEEAVLRRAYESALARAGELDVRSVALPLVSAHTFGFPVRLSYLIAVQACRAFLEDHDMDVRLVLRDEDAMAVGSSLHADIAAYIDDHYVEEQAALYRAEQGPSFAGERPIQAPMPPDEGGSGSRWDRQLAGQKQGAPMVAHSAAQDAPLLAHPKEKGRRGLLSGLSGLVGTVLEKASERNEQAASKPRPGAFAARDESGQERSQGPALTPKRVDELRETSKPGVCPRCGYEQIGSVFCPHCGYKLPAGPGFDAREPNAGSFDALREWAEDADAASPPDGRWETGSFAPVEVAPRLDAADYGAYDDAEGAPLLADADGGEGWEDGEGLEDAEEAPRYAGYAVAYEMMPAAGLMPTDASMPAAAETAPFAEAPVASMAPGDSLAAWLDKLDAPFSTTLLALIDARGLTDVQVYKRANMSRQLFSKIRSDASYRPTKKTVLALAVALCLDLAQTTDLLRRAGFALSHSSKSDVIVEYFIVNGKYDIFELNEALYAFDQPLL